MFSDWMKIIIKLSENNYSSPEKARKIDMYDLDSVEKTVPYFKFIAPEEK